MRVAGVNVTLSWPARSSDAPISGVSFLLPGAMISISEYDSLRDVITAQNNLVVSTFMNVLWPLTNNHRKHAQNVKNIFDELKSIFYNELKSVSKYSLIGHSVGGKVALLVASIIDTERVLAVLALDPIDFNPVEFSKPKGANLPLGDEGADFHTMDAGNKNCKHDEEVVHVVRKKHQEKQTITGEDESGHDRVHRNIQIILTYTDGGRGIPKAHNASAIHKFHPVTTKCYYHKNAGHMAYCDDGGGWFADKVMPNVGTKEGNQKALATAHDLIRQMLRP